MVTIVLIDFLITLVLMYFFIKVKFEKDELRERLSEVELKNKLLLEYYEVTCKLLNSKK